MPQPQNMFLVCVTVGLVLLASKYRNNVLRSVKHFCHGIRNRGGDHKKKDDTEDKGEFKIALDKIILADSPEKCDYAVQRIRCDSSDGVLGFDCEWVNEGPVALLQLATHSGICALFRIGKIGYVPLKLKELLASRNILKVGVASFEDGQKVVNDYGCRVFGTLDLRTLAERLDLPCPKSLAALSLKYLSLEMDKIIEVRCGDWNANTLTDEQVAYAACDAIASVLIYHQIMKAARQKQSLWENFRVRVKSMWRKNRDTQFCDIPEGIIDTRFKAQKLSTANNNSSKNLNISRILKGFTNNKNIMLKTSSIPTRNKPLYHNCYLQAPDGDILCTCDRKKAEWYVARNLGVIVGDDPFTVKLNFEPSGRALGEVGQYYTQVKVNQCVVCGSTEKFIRKNVVPREYRKYFPLVMKAHQSHDVLLLCPPCHEISNSHDLQLRRKLADMCDAPLIVPMTHTRDKRTNNLRKLHSAVKALQGKSMLPLRRRKELECYVAEATGHQDLNPRLLAGLSEELKHMSLLPDTTDSSQPHGLKVVEYFQKKEGGLVVLERMWREHFLLTMNPKYLPRLWSVCHNQERLTIRQTQNRIEPEDAKIAGLVC